MDVNGHGSGEWVVMRVMEGELGGKEEGIVNGSVCGMNWWKMSFGKIAKSTMVKWMSENVKMGKVYEWMEDGVGMMEGEWESDRRGG